MRRRATRRAALSWLPLRALDWRYQARGVQRYGFHGLSYAYLIEELARAAGSEAAHGRVILAHGEATGHAHAIKAEGAALFRDPKLMTIFMKVSGDAVALEHDEHKTITIPPGNYRVIRQREYSPSEIRNVAD